jgi:hypothetical protein
MHRIAIWLTLAATLAAIGWFSMRLAGVRIYHADECQNMFTTQLLTTGQLRNGPANVSPFLAMLSRLTRNSTQAIDLLVRARFLMLEIFWLNLVLIALATGEVLTSPRGLIALLGAATLAPLWDYGFEIRYDNVLLTGVLLTWCVVRVRPAGVQSYAIAGAVAAVIQLITFEAFVYFVPITLLILAFPPPGHKAPRWKLALAWFLSALAVLVLIRLIYGGTAISELYKTGFHRVEGAGTGDIRFWPWQSLSRLLGQTPLLLALLGGALLGIAGDLRRRGKAALTWNSSLPEAFLFCVALIALAISPNPYPNNLLQLVSYGFLFAFRYASALSTEFGDVRLLRPAVAAVVVFAHLVPFGSATSRHWKWTNFRQEQLMGLAERLTNPERDPVYDDVGMVPTRSTIHASRSLHIQDSAEGPGQVREMLAARPAAVFIPSYRTDWLAEKDHEFIRERYVSLADDFWVLGKVLPSGGGTFEIFHPGRYRISTLKGSDLDGTYPVGWEGMTTPEDKGTLSGTLDGAPLSVRPVELTVGTHRLECAQDCQAAVVWMGPRLERVHRINPGDHRMLFVNWY